MMKPVSGRKLTHLIGNELWSIVSDKGGMNSMLSKNGLQHYMVMLVEVVELSFCISTKHEKIYHNCKEVCCLV